MFDNHTVKGPVHAVHFEMPSTINATKFAIVQQAYMTRTPLDVNNDAQLAAAQEYFQLLIDIHAEEEHSSGASDSSGGSGSGLGVGRRILESMQASNVPIEHTPSELSWADRLRAAADRSK